MMCSRSVSMRCGCGLWKIPPRLTLTPILTIHSAWPASARPMKDDGTMMSTDILADEEEEEYEEVEEKNAEGIITQIKRKKKRSLQYLLYDLALIKALYLTLTLSLTTTRILILILTLTVILTLEQT